MIAADRGLVRRLQLDRHPQAENDIRRQQDQGRDTAIVTVGRKPEGYFRFRDFPIDASFGGFTENPAYEDAREVAAAVIGPFQSGELDLVQVTYTTFVSAGRQEVVIVPLLPLPEIAAAPEPGGAAPDHEGPSASYEFEPGPDTILEALLPRYAEARIYAALLNAAASEHAARQRAMKAATDNADELIRELSPRDEPRPAGRDHDRDHGDRRRRRGAALRRGRRRRARALRFRWCAGRAHRQPQRTLIRSIPSMTATAEPTTKTNDEALKNGRVVAIYGPVVDVEFPPDALPEINHALEMDIELEGEKSSPSPPRSRSRSVRVVCARSA